MRSVLSLVSSFVLVSACQLTTGAPHQYAALTSSTCPLDSGSCVPVSAPLARADLCLDDRWVALLKSQGDCPVPQGAVGGRWRASPLFRRDPTWVVPPALRLYCLYRWEPAGMGNPPDLVNLATVDARFERRDTDCAAVKSSAESRAIETTWPSLRSQFFAQVGHTALPPGGESVRVAIIDSAPTNLTPGPVAADRSGHGEAMGQIVNELACPADGGVCPTKVVTHLALPLISIGREDEVHGGRFGYQSQIALAVFDAVAEWRLFNALGGPQHRRLVLNLSVGWEPVFGGDAVSPTDFPAPVRAVYTALLHARCQGAAPIVAAGNDTGGSPVERGALFPAAWEARAAPDATTCGAIEGSTYSPAGLLAAPTPNDYQPLVFSVSGVRGDNVALTNARLDGHARLVAPAAHVAVQSVAGGPTAGLTGSSVAAAVVSASAAAAWSYRPELPASALMARVWGGAMPLGGTPDYCLGGAPCPVVAGPQAGVRRVSMCGAVAAACATGAGSCPASPPSCGPLSLVATTLTKAELTTIGQYAVRLKAGAGGLIAQAPEICGAQATFESTSSVFPETVCADRQYQGLGSKPALGAPQPGSNPCPAACAVVPNDGTVYLSLDPKFLSLGLTDATLKLGNDYLALDVKTLQQTPEAIIEGVKVDPSIESATLLFKVDGSTEDFSTESELIIKR